MAEWEKSERQQALGGLKETAPFNGSPALVFRGLNSQVSASVFSQAPFTNPGTVKGKIAFLFKYIIPIVPALSNVVGNIWYKYKDA